MATGLSLYLDLLRFALAAVVVLSHAANHVYTTPGFLWFMRSYGATAVIGFFVLSGFVIAHVAAGRENTAVSYGTARVARLFSVIVPALLLTAVLDAWGVSIAPGFYRPDYMGDGQPLRYFLSFFMVQNFAVLNLYQPLHMSLFTPGTNEPFWSMSYEATYYALFAIALFMRGPARAVSWAVLAILAGPAIMTLFPVWLLGVAVYRLRGRIAPPLPLALCGFIASLVLLAIVGWQRNGPWLEWPLTERMTQLDYAEAILFALNLLMADRLAGLLAAGLGWCAPAVRWLGGLTFAMYLCHRPLLHFFAVPAIGGPISVAQTTRLLVLVFVVVVVMAWLTDWLRLWLRVFLRGRMARASVPAT